ncbi:MAG TPA: type II toxin-antitoxin system VapC family toxin [Polyangiaceae bacterium]|nr:type II toxin-antitoxin system VapC family toxin [Polyangiaceae bacterium]
MVLLDTNLCLLIIKKAPPKALERLLACAPDEVGLSVITLGELAHGVAQSSNPDKNREALELFLAALRVVEFSAEAALTWGQLRAQLDAKGTAMGALDAMIAAQALSLGATLATSTPKAFRSIKGLTLENWTR